MPGLEFGHFFNRDGQRADPLACCVMDGVCDRDRHPGDGKYADTLVPSGVIESGSPTKSTSSSRTAFTGTTYLVSDVGNKLSHS